ncbi:hypothetical protein D3C76_215450 [compost metagenome]
MDRGELTQRSIPTFYSGDDRQLTVFGRVFTRRQDDKLAAIPCCHARVVKSEFFDVLNKGTELGGRESVRLIAI